MRRLRACISRGDVDGGCAGDTSDTVHRELTTLEAEKDRLIEREQGSEVSRSEQELAIEQADKERLQQRIEDLSSKLLTSGSGPGVGSVSPMFQDFVRSTGADVGDQRAEADEDERKLAKYRQTLERQRLMMIALTKRLLTRRGHPRAAKPSWKV